MGGLASGTSVGSGGGPLLGIDVKGDEVLLERIFTFISRPYISHADQWAALQTGLLREDSMAM